MLKRRVRQNRTTEDAESDNTELCREQDLRLRFKNQGLTKKDNSE